MERLQKIHEALDPIKILNQMKCLLESLWKYACTDYPSEEKYTEKLTTNSSDIQQGILQRFKKVEKPKVSHNWRTRKDPFEEVWDQIVGWLNENSEQTAKAILERLHVDYPGQYKKNQLRTLQRKIKTWRSQVILEFNDTWLQEEITAGRTFPLSLTAKSI
jgi:ABC-type phosphate/phosphonate transport system ATPase subunit